jgi:glutaredoxin-related protein
MSNNKNILFYSTQCNLCKTVMQILKQENMATYFNYVCIDDPQIRSRIPKTITHIPTAIIPSMNKIFVGNDILQWIQTLRISRAQHSNVSASSIQRRMEVLNQQPQNNKNTQDKVPQATPLGFVTQEMAGISDTYAYTTVEQAPRHTYSSYNEIETKLYTAPQEDHKITINNQSKHIQQAERKRKDQDEVINDIFKKQCENIHILNAKRQETENLIQKIVVQQQQNIDNLFDK